MISVLRPLARKKNTSFSRGVRACASQTLSTLLRQCPLLSAFAFSSKSIALSMLAIASTSLLDAKGVIATTSSSINTKVSETTCVVSEV